MNVRSAVNLLRVLIHFIRAAQRHISRNGSFSIALTGGNTPRGLHRLLATEGFHSQVEWARVQVFWGDERSVSPDHPDSNFGMAHRDLLSKIPIPPEHVHRMKADLPEPDVALGQYTQALKRHLALDSGGFLRFHLVLLAIGLNGHLASLFPASESLEETTEWVTSGAAPTADHRRMKLTLPLLNAAHEVLFLVAGADRARILRTMLIESCDPPLPCQLVTVPDGLFTVLADEAAPDLVASGT